MTTAVVGAATGQRQQVDAHRVATALVFSVLALSTITLHPWDGPWWGAPGSVALFVAAVCAACGNRAAGWVTVVVGVPVLGIPQWDGSVSHYHHLIWFAVVLLVGRDGPWLRCLFALWGFIYLAPGLAKLGNAGSLIDGGMAGIFARVREQHDWSMWIPGGAWFPALSAVAVIVFEVTMPFLLFTRWRKPAAVMGLGFHLSTWWVLGIPFLALSLLYPILFLDQRDEGDDMRPVIVTAVIIVLSVWAGQKGWPFAQYPHFAG